MRIFSSIDGATEVLEAGGASVPPSVAFLGGRMGSFLRLDSLLLASSTGLTRLAAEAAVGVAVSASSGGLRDPNGLGATVATKRMTALLPSAS